MKGGVRGEFFDGNEFGMLQAAFSAKAYRTDISASVTTNASIEMSQP
jgi:hypothetical protein